MLERSRWARGAVVASIAAAGCGEATPGDGDGDLSESRGALGSVTRYFVPPPDPGAVTQIADLVERHDWLNALRLTAMVSTPRAVWFTGGTAHEVAHAVERTIRAAKHQRRTPVLVAYNIPYRECGRYVSGGAPDAAAYEAWIEAFARGIGEARAVVILEPDSLGIIPWHNVKFWCKPSVPGQDGRPVPAPGATPEDRYALLQFAVAELHRRAPHADVYLDATHSSWLGVGDAAYRLARAGRDPGTGELLARGFYVNAANYQTTEQAAQFGTWISMCTAFATNPEDGGWRLGQFLSCPTQYNPAKSFAIDYSAEYAASVTAELEALMGTATATLPFVIDTSRSGRGALDLTPYGEAPYNQPPDVLYQLESGTWCNQPGRGVGLRPKSNTGVLLLDAYLWIKTPGQSDGSCDRAGLARAWDYSAYNPWGVTGAAADHFDPLWGTVDPPAGDWFPAQALELAQQAVPPLF